MIPWPKIFIGIAIVTFIVGGFTFIKVHLSNDEERAAELAEQIRINQELAYNLANEQAARKVYKERVDDSIRSLEMVQREMEESRKLSREMVAVFERHDLAALIRAKPGLVTDRVRSGTERLWGDMEAAVATEPGDR